MGKTKELAKRIEGITFSLVTEIPAFSQNRHRGTANQECGRGSPALLG